jgi:hypothetical protein
MHNLGSQDAEKAHVHPNDEHVHANPVHVHGIAKHDHINFGHDEAIVELVSSAMAWLHHAQHFYYHALQCHGHDDDAQITHFPIRSIHQCYMHT